METYKNENFYKNDNYNDDLRNYNFGCWRATPTIIIIPVWG